MAKNSNNLSTFRDRLAFGVEAENLILKDLKSRNIKAVSSKIHKNWSPYFDSRFGDILINDKFFVDVKRTKFISLKSLNNFEGNFYLILPKNMDLSNTFFVTPSIIKWKVGYKKGNWPHTKAVLKCKNGPSYGVVIYSIKKIGIPYLEFIKDLKKSK